MIGLASFAAQYVVKGLILSPTGFYVSVPVSALGSIGSIGIRSHFSKIVEPYELGKVSSLMAAIESIVPFIGSFFYTTIFNATMDSMVGLSFLITSGILVVPFVIMIWIHFFTVLPDFAANTDNNDDNSDAIKASDDSPGQALSDV